MEQSSINMGSSLPAPWMLGAKDINDTPMFVVFMSNGELEGMDDLQGGPSIDEETGWREYSALAELAEIPEVRQLFHELANEIAANKGKVTEGTREAYQAAKQNSLPFRETEEEKESPLKDLEKKGRNGDSKLAYVPENFLELLIETGHKPTINPALGVLEFGFFDELLRIGGTIAGAIFGGPLGAGAGNAIAGLVTGKKPVDALIGGVKNAGLAYGANALGLNPAALLGGATKGLTALAPTAMAPGVAASTAAPAAAATTATAAPSGILGGLSALAPYAGPLALAGTAGLSYLGQKQHHKHLQKERERQDAYNAKWEQKYEPQIATPWEPNPEFWQRTDEDIRHGRIHSPYTRETKNHNRYARGGAVQSCSEGTIVKGKGKGQDDLIKTTVPEQSYIWDASTVSMLGDGSSRAGAKVIKKFEEQVKKRVPKKVRHNVERVIKKSVQQAPVFLSDNEYKSDPVTVSLIPLALGRKEISNEKGAAILREGIKNIRKHKSSAGSGLPPKAKSIIEYMTAR